MRILYLTHISPFPPRGGEQIRAAGLLHLLSQLGDVEAIIGDAHELPATLSKEYPKVIFHPFSFQTQMKPVTRYFFFNQALRDLLDKILEVKPIELVFIDYQFYGHYIPYFKERGIPVIYGTHNAEAELTRQEITLQKGKKFAEKSLLYLIQHSHERLFFKQADLFVTVSAKDRSYYQRFVPAENIIVLPNFLYPQLYGSEPEQALQPKTRRLVITANFTVFQNREGAHWFMKKVWSPLRLEERYRLQLVGRGSTELLQEALTQTPTLLNVSATGVVERVQPYLQGAFAALAPLLHGSGTRLKILEAFWYGVPVIATPLGAEGFEGTNHVHYLLANRPQDFAKYLNELEDHLTWNAMSKAASALLLEKYHIEPNTRHLYSELYHRGLWHEQPFTGNV